MNRNTMLAGLLALASACATDPSVGTAADFSTATCPSSPTVADITSDDSSILVGGTVAMTVTCSTYADPRINGSPAEFDAFFEQYCSLSLAPLPTNTDCDPTAVPVRVDPVTNIVTITQCVDACTGVPYTAEGGTFVDVPPGIDVYDALCQTSGPFAGCCDYFDVAPGHLNSCDRVFDYTSGSWIQTAGPVTATTQSPTQGSVGIAMHGPSDVTFPRATSRGFVAAMMDPPPPGGGPQPPPPPAGDRASVLKALRNLIASGLIAGIPQGSEIGEKLGQALEQAHAAIERKAQQMEQTKPVQGPPPIVSPNKPPQPSILVPPRPTLPGTKPPAPPTSSGPGPVKPPAPPPVKPPAPPKPPGKG